MLGALAIVALASAALDVRAQTPLADLRFEYDALPYQADPNDGERGRQYGYNICNSTTEGPDSHCQTAIINSIDDFCLWGPPEPNSLIGDTEGEAVAWCSKAGHGTRILPEGTITGVQFIRTDEYVQVTGTINQQFMNIAVGDSGGEMDPHGADQRGNPLGGLLFSTAFGDGYRQVIEWHNFMGENVFCLKACDPDSANGPRYCEHIFDRIGCWFNAPAPYEEGVFESCLGELQDFPGIYTNAAGEEVTYTQPPEDLGPITTMPYQPRRPESSQCSQYESAALFTDAPRNTAARPTTSTTRSTTRTTSNTRSSSATETADDASSASRISGGFLGAALVAGLVAAF